jgi:hypothetical protein
MVKSHPVGGLVAWPTRKLGTPIGHRFEPGEPNEFC